MSRSPEDWELLYLHCDQKLRRHLIEYPRTTIGNWSQYFGRISVQPYIEALNIFADDRKETTKYAQEAQASGHPIYFDKFIGLAEVAHEGGNQQALRQGVTELLRWVDRWNHELDWKNMCQEVRDFAIPLYDEAKKLEFDENIVRDQAKILLHRSLVELEKGTEYIPSVLFEGPPSGNVKPEADEGLSWVEEVRELTRYFELDGEREYATDIMNRYLKEALCLLQNGHQWYLDLSKEYGLMEAREYVEGFYATMYGKVEIEIDGRRTAASGVKVVVTDPHDGRTWETTADEDGQYEIEEVILHELCSPFTIECEYGEEKMETPYVGPLTEPNKNERYEKDLLFEWKMELEIRWSGGCVSFGQKVQRFPLSLNSREDADSVEWHGKVENSCKWDDIGLRSAISTVANMNIEGELVSEEDGKKLKLTFDWSGVETVTFRLFNAKDSHPVGGKVNTEAPFVPGDYGFTLIEGARGITIPHLKPEQYTKSIGFGGNYTVGNWAVLSIKSL